MRSLSLLACSLCFHDVIKEFLQLKCFPHLPFLPTKQFAELAELLKANKHQFLFTSYSGCRLLDLAEC